MKNASILGVLVFLAIVPVTLSFLFTGKDEDRVRAPRPAPVRTAPAAEEPAEAPAAIPLDQASAAKGVPVFKGFEDSRYQQYDAAIQKFVEDFNRSRARWAGSTPSQAEHIAPLSAAQIKAHMIQETGGGDLQSRTAWKFDPLQVNVPGDWNPYKKYLGLREPRRRNEGSGDANLKAGLMLLVRKGFGVSGQPAANRPDGAFDGWARALQRYNGRSDKAATGERYSDAYSARIRARAEKPTEEVPIPIPTMKSK